MVYLIGIDHMAQYNGPLPESIRAEFRSDIIRICRENGIAVIAEEFSEEALREVYHASADTAREAALILGIEHRYCDPGGKELAELGIPSFGDLMEEAKRKFQAPPSYLLECGLREKVKAHAVVRARSYWQIRENYWYERVHDVLDQDILFICGHEHVERFRVLLRERGHQCEIINRFWKEELFSDYKNLGLE